MPVSMSVIRAAMQVVADQHFSAAKTPKIVVHETSIGSLESILSSGRIKGLSYDSASANKDLADFFADDPDAQVDADYGNWVYTTSWASGTGFYGVTPNECAILIKVPAIKGYKYHPEIEGGLLMAPGSIPLSAVLQIYVYNESPTPKLQALKAKYADKVGIFFVGRKSAVAAVRNLNSR